MLNKKEKKRYDKALEKGKSKDFVFQEMDNSPFKNQNYRLVLLWFIVKDFLLTIPELIIGLLSLGKIAIGFSKILPLVIVVAGLFVLLIQDLGWAVAFLLSIAIYIYLWIRRFGKLEHQLKNQKS